MKPYEVAIVIGGDLNDLIQKLAEKTTFIRIQNYEMLMKVVLSTDTPSPQTIIWENADESLLENPSRYLIRMFQWGRFFNTGCIFTFKNNIIINPCILGSIDYHIVSCPEATSLLQGSPFPSAAERVAH
jgi:hypothetical protein